LWRFFGILIRPKPQREVQCDLFNRYSIEIRDYYNNWIRKSSNVTAIYDNNNVLKQRAPLRDHKTYFSRTKAQFMYICTVDGHAASYDTIKRLYFNLHYKLILSLPNNDDELNCPNPFDKSSRYPDPTSSWTHMRNTASWTCLGPNDLPFGIASLRAGQSC